jgi:membrane fusion protein (multidrug efflux system)
MLPGHFRPELSDSLAARFMPAGYRHSYQELEIRSINDEVVGPAEARRYVGSEVADAVDLAGPVVLVEAHLPAAGFRDGARTLAYHDGMQGTLEVKLESKPIILSLLPALKNIREASHE